MTLTRFYLTGSIVIGLMCASILVNMISHSIADSLSYIIGALCLLWIPICLVAIFGMYKRPLYCFSPLLYITYIIVNYFTAPDSSFEASFDFTHILCLVFGLVYAFYNSLLLYKETKTQKIGLQS